jgi:capsular exopolysaccharide synthesis family protein
LPDEHAQSTAREALGFLRRRRWVILGLTVVGAAVAVALSLGQAKVYTADASLRVREATQDLSIAGLQAAQSDLPAQTAAQSAQTANREAVLQRVRTVVPWAGTTAAIRSHVTATQDAQSNLVHVTATAGTGAHAASLANAAAGAIADITNRDTAGRFAKLARKLREESDRLASELPKNFAKLSPAKRGAYQTNLRQQQVLGEQAARLQALAAVTQVAQVAEPATAPSSPTSPDPVKSGLLGGIAGLVIGLLAALLLDSLDRRLRNTEAAEDRLGLPVTGSLFKGWLGDRAAAEGDARERDVRMGAFRMIRNNLRFLAGSEPPRVVVVTSSGAEEGKTTTALGLAQAAASSRMRTLLIEADLHRPVLAERLGLNASPGLAEVLHDELPLDEVVQAAPPPVAPANGTDPRTAAVDVVTAGAGAAASFEFLGGEEFAALLAHARSVYDLVVIDTAPVLAVAETMQVAAQADAILYCVRIRRTVASQVVAGKVALERLPPRFIGLVLTDVPREDGSYGYAYGYGPSGRAARRSKDDVEAKA